MSWIWSRNIATNIEINRIGVKILYSGAIALAASVFGGIPEPGTVLYGQVQANDQSLLSDGTLEVTLSTPSGGEPITLSTPLDTFMLNGTLIAYRLTIPLETRVSGAPNRANTLPIEPSPVSYEGHAVVRQDGEVMSEANFTLVVSRENRGKLVRLDIGVTDTDNDGLPDDWEREHFGNLGGVEGDLQNPEDDFDGDGLSNLLEYELGTDPTQPNIPDGEDTDGDGIPDALEAALGLNPNATDSDDNGVADADEDFDGDGASNGDEIAQGTNPAVWVGNVERGGSSDNEIDIADVTLLIQRIVLGTTGSLDFDAANAETSGSSADVIDIADVTRLIQYVTSGESGAL